MCLPLHILDPEANVNLGQALVLVNFVRPFAEVSGVKSVLLTRHDGRYG